jgi:short-subunit dehydrogenase
MAKTAVITGATSGIGAAYANRLAADGYDLVITGRKKEIIQKLAVDLAAKHSVKIDVIIAELSDDSGLQKLIDAVKTKNDIELLINNAGYSGYARHFEETDVAEHEKMVKLHQIVPLRLISFILPGMIKQGKGTIINVSSTGAFLPMPSNSVYVATKAFLKSYSQVMYQELKSKKVRVQVLCPGFTKTNFAREYYPEDVYERMMSQAKMVTMTPEKVVDYSLKSLNNHNPVCVPGLLNKVMVFIFPLLPMSIFSRLVSRMANFQ